MEFDLGDRTTKTFITDKFGNIIDEGVNVANYLNTNW